jgi:hypothetical protein
VSDEDQTDNEKFEWTEGDIRWIVPPDDEQQ